MLVCIVHLKGRSTLSSISLSSGAVSKLLTVNNVYHGDRMNRKGDTSRNIASKGIIIIAAYYVSWKIHAVLRFSTHFYLDNNHMT